MTMISILVFIVVLMGYVFSIELDRPMSKLKIYGIFFLGAVLLIATITAVILQNFILINEGLSMQGVKGYIVSLLPTILLSLFVWALKRKLMQEKLSQRATRIPETQGE